MILVSVPGKIHLLGEHTVVYGKPALFASINLRLKLSLKKSSRFKATLNDSDYTQVVDPLKKVLEKKIKQNFGKNIPPHQMIINSEIPLGFGLGSSAALSVAYSAALMKLMKINFDNQLLYEIAFEGEKIFHGNPSGADVAAVINGGFLWFRKEAPNFRLSFPVTFKNIKKLDQFYLIDSGKPKESTKKMVEIVFQKLNKDKSKVVKIFNNQEELTRQLLVALDEGNAAMLIRILRQGQANLESLGVVSEISKKIIKRIEKIGGSAKILGGGGIKAGTGMLLVYCQNKKELDKLVLDEMWSIIPISLGEEGLKIG